MMEFTQPKLANSGTDKAFTGSIPALYDRLMVPLIFAGYAEDLARRTAEAISTRSGPTVVLEVAAGTGVVTKALRQHLPSSTRIVATDLNQAMLDHAQGTLPGDAHLSWRVADALDLPFADESFDVVICQFGAMFFPDKSDGYREARRVLKPKGRYLFNVWDRLERNNLPHAVIEILRQLLPGHPPRFLERLPHGYYDPLLIRLDLTRAGFDAVDIERLVLDSHASNADVVAQAFCEGTPMRNELENQSSRPLSEITQAVATGLRQRLGDGGLHGAISALVVSCTK